MRARPRVTAFLLLAAVAACSDPGVSSGGGERGALRLSLAADGVAGVRYSISCPGGSSFELFAPGEAEGLPHHLGSEHTGAPFADLFVLAPEGTCSVTGVVMASPTEPMAECYPASVDVAVTAGETAEVVLVIRCGVLAATRRSPAAWAGWQSRTSNDPRRRMPTARSAGHPLRGRGGRSSDAGAGLLSGSGVA